MITTKPLQAAGSPLVAGNATGGRTVATATKVVQVMRPFYLKAVLQEKGRVLTVDANLANELVALNKARFHVEEQSAADKQTVRDEAAATARSEAKGHK